MTQEDASLGSPTRPRVSVCVFTYNHRSYIADCLLSVLAQDVDADVDVWVGDDMSDDGTTDVIATLAAAWPGRLHHVIHATRQGPIGNLRHMVALADGDLIAHLDGDDFWLPGKLREQLSILRDQPACGACCTNAMVFDDHREPVGIFSNARSCTFDVAGLLRRGNFLNHSSLLYRSDLKSVLLEIAPPFIDYRIHLTLALHGGMAYTSKVLVGYRANSSGSMLIRDNDMVRRQYFEAITEASSLVPATVRSEASADFVRRVAFRALRLRRLALLRQWWVEASQNASEPRWKFVVRCAAFFFMECARQGFQSLSGTLLRTRTRVLYFR